MGWLFSIALFIVGLIKHNDTLIITSGLYSIAGAIGVYNQTKKKD